MTELFDRELLYIVLERQFKNAHQKRPLKSGLSDRAVIATTCGLEAFAFDPLAFQLTGAADRLCLFTGAAFGRLFIGTAHFHFTENAFALHLFLQCAERLIDVVVSNGYFHGSVVSCRAS